MEVPFHYILLRTFCYPTEIRETVRKSLVFIARGDGDDMPANVEERPLEGSFGDEIIIMEIKIDRARDIKEFCRRAFPMFDVANIDTRIDNNLFLNLRFSKEKAAEGCMDFAHDGNIISMKGKIKAYPASRENALNTITEAVGEYHNN